MATLCTKVIKVIGEVWLYYAPRLLSKWRGVAKLCTKIIKEMRCGYTTKQGYSSDEVATLWTKVIKVRGEV